MLSSSMVRVGAVPSTSPALDALITIVSTRSTMSSGSASMVADALLAPAGRIRVFVAAV